MRFLKLCVIAAAFIGLCGFVGCTKEEPKTPAPAPAPEAPATPPAPTPPPAPAQ